MGDVSRRSIIGFSFLGRAVRFQRSAEALTLPLSCQIRLLRQLSYHNARLVDGGVGQAEGRDDAVAAAGGGAEVDEEDLVFVVLDDFAENVPALGEVDGRELALEDRVLQVVAEVAHGLIDPAEAFVVADVVADEIGVSHGLDAFEIGGGPASVPESRTRHNSAAGSVDHPLSVHDGGGDATIFWRFITAARRINTQRAVPVPGSRVIGATRWRIIRAGITMSRHVTARLDG